MRFFLNLFIGKTTSLKSLKIYKFLALTFFFYFDISCFQMSILNMYILQKPVNKFYIEFDFWYPTLTYMRVFEFFLTYIL